MTNNYSRTHKSGLYHLNILIENYDDILSVEFNDWEYSLIIICKEDYNPKIIEGFIRYYIPIGVRYSIITRK